MKNKTSPINIETYQMTNSDDKDQQLFFSERVNLLYNQPLHLVLFAQAITLILTTWYLWNSETQYVLIIWLVLSLIATSGMAYNVEAFKKETKINERSKHWLTLFVISMFINGSIWGSPAFFSNIFDSTSSVMFVAFLLLGLVAIAATIISSFISLFYIYSIISLLPMTVMFFYNGGTLYNSLGGMYLMYFAVQVINANNMHKVLLSSLQLRHQNIDLVNNLKVKNQQAELAKEEAEQANVSKSKFLAAASHDLRQPLHALGLFVSKIYNNQRYPKIKNDIENIKKSSDALEGLLNALLDISKLDAGVLQPDLSPVSLQAILNKVTTHGKSHAQDKGLTFRVRDINKTIQTDSLMLERILNNLVSNAIRYTNTGTVFIGCRKRGEKIRIEVRDSGIGITEDKLGEIFEEFYQAENPERDRTKGLGLGLAIVERLCSLLNYKIDVYSIPGKGSLFSIEVPCVDTTSLHYTEATSTENFISDVQGMHVLVIDDEEMIRKGMAAMLEGWECPSLLAESADSAISQLEQIGFTPDIIISDYRLRENKTGAQAIKQIIFFLQKDIPAIIVTGDTAPDRLQEVKESGHQLLHKPVSPAKLRSIMSYLRKQKSI